MLPQGPVLVPHCHPSLTDEPTETEVGRGEEGEAELFILFIYCVMRDG